MRLVASWLKRPCRQTVEKNLDLQKVQVKLQDWRLFNLIQDERNGNKEQILSYRGQAS